MPVVSGRDEDGLRSELPDPAQQLVPGCDKGLVVRPGQQGHVVLRPDRCAATPLLGRAASRVERALVRRRVQELRVVVEDRLGPVAVVHVPVDDRDALREAGPAQCDRGDRDVVEQAETRGATCRCVVAGRARHREANPNRPARDL